MAEDCWDEERQGPKPDVPAQTLMMISGMQERAGGSKVAVQSIGASCAWPCGAVEAIDSGQQGEATTRHEDSEGGTATTKTTKR